MSLKYFALQRFEKGVPMQVAGSSLKKREDRGIGDSRISETMLALSAPICQQRSLSNLALADRMLNKGASFFSRITAAINFEMSLRRKACEPCFRGRRRCDLSYPICERCQKNGKRCHYKYPSRLPMRDNTANVDDATVIGMQTGTVSPQLISYPGQLRSNLDGHAV
jgi:hypothetical protein